MNNLARTVVMAALVTAERADSYMAFAIAIVLAFYCTTGIAMLFPVAGPEYYQPGLFRYLDGSISQQLQEYLGRYQVGGIPQNGLLYGKMSMPSLHVALTAMATWFVARHWPVALWYAIPCAALIWISTVVLAWHYALDGVAALGMAWLCLAVAQKSCGFRGWSGSGERKSGCKGVERQPLTAINRGKIASNESGLPGGAHHNYRGPFATQQWGLN